MDITTTEIIGIIFGSTFVLFIPGIAWSFVFFKKEEIPWIERIVISFGLSISFVPLTVFYSANIFGMKVNIINISIIILVLIGIATGIYVLKNLKIQVTRK